MTSGAGYGVAPVDPVGDVDGASAPAVTEHAPAVTEHAPGSMRVGDETVPAPRGTVVRVAPATLRSAVNDGESDARWMMFGARRPAVPGSGTRAPRSSTDSPTTMNWSRHLELVPHYVANLVLVILAIGALRRFVGDPGIAVEFGVVVVIVLAYPSVVRRLGVAPSAWDEPERGQNGDSER